MINLRTNIRHESVVVAKQNGRYTCDALRLKMMWLESEQANECNGVKSERVCVCVRGCLPILSLSLPRSTIHAVFGRRRYIQFSFFFPFVHIRRCVHFKSMQHFINWIAETVNYSSNLMNTWLTVLLFMHCSDIKITTVPFCAVNSCYSYCCCCCYGNVC